MSLQVWLPLNGDLHNQGLSDITVTNNGATVDNNGKIGKCYRFDGNSYLQASSLSGAQSICFWVKLEKKNSLQVVFVDYKSKLAFGFNKNNYIIVSCVDKNIDMYSDTNFPNNVWTHIALVYTSDNSDILLYINGILQTVRLTGNYWVHTTDNLIIGARYNGSIASYMTGYINDFRIYNHALSAKEVEEIAKGLVLHYKLDDQFCESTTNLCNNLKTGGRTVLSTNPLMITTTGENADTYWYVKTSSALVSGTVYTISLNCTGLSSGEYWKFGVGAQSGANNCGYFSIYQGYNTFTFTLPSGLNGATQLILDDMGGSSGIRGKITNFFNVQLEAKDHATGYAGVGGSRVATTIYDSSGYGNNGTIVDSLEIAIPSPRYSVATSFNGTNNNITFTPMLSNATNCTIALWIKPTQANNNSKCFFSLEQNTSWQLTMWGTTCSIRDTSIGVSGTRQNYSLGSFTANTWYHLVCTYSAGILKIYKNGTLLSTNIVGGTALNVMNHGRLGSAVQDNYYWDGSESDCRIYATALTPEQVKELYTTSMSIDNNGNIHARELVEL